MNPVVLLGELIEGLIALLWRVVARPLAALLEWIGPPVWAALKAPAAIIWSFVEAGAVALMEFFAWIVRGLWRSVRRVFNSTAKTKPSGRAVEAERPEGDAKREDDRP